MRAVRRQLLLKDLDAALQQRDRVGVSAFGRELQRAAVRLQRLPEATFVTTAATLRSGWADGFGKPKRGDGAAARALSVKVSCQLVSVLDEERNSASFLLRPGLV